MSRFIDKLNSITQTAPPLGFRARKTARPQPKLLLLASLEKTDIDRLAADLAGIDAGLLETPDIDGVTEAVVKVPDLPWGVRLEKVDSEGLAGVTGAGADFVMFPSGSIIGETDSNEKAGRLLEVGDNLGESWLRAVNKLPVDAVVIGGEAAENLTWRRLMQIQYCADLMTKPVLALVPVGVTAGQLQAIGRAGVAGIVVPVAAGQPEGRLAELRKTIDGLDLTAPRRKDKAMALLPQVNGGGEAEIEEPGEPEDE